MEQFAWVSLNLQPKFLEGNPETNHIQGQGKWSARISIFVKKLTDSEMNFSWKDLNSLEITIKVEGTYERYKNDK